MPTKAPRHSVSAHGVNHADVLRHRKKNEQANRRRKKRKYPTNSTLWIRIRNFKRKKNPLCEYCEKKGLVVQMDDVDHIDGDDSNCSWENLQSLCKSCHSRKTAKENGGFGHY